MDRIILLDRYLKLQRQIKTDISNTEAALTQGTSDQILSTMEQRTTGQCKRRLMLLSVVVSTDRTYLFPYLMLSHTVEAVRSSHIDAPHEVFDYAVDRDKMRL